MFPIGDGHQAAGWCTRRAATSKGGSERMPLRQVTGSRGFVHRLILATAPIAGASGRPVLALNHVAGRS
jgi:hypothetical protein